MTGCPSGSGSDTVPETMPIGDCAAAPVAWRQAIKRAAQQVRLKFLMPADGARNGPSRRGWPGGAISLCLLGITRISIRRAGLEQSRVTARPRAVRLSVSRGERDRGRDAGPPRTSSGTRNGIRYPGIRFLEGWRRSQGGARERRPGKRTPESSYESAVSSPYLRRRPYN
jgi:hypothetical protein